MRVLGPILLSLQIGCSAVGAGFGAFCAYTHNNNPRNFEVPPPSPPPPVATINERQCLAQRSALYTDAMHIADAHERMIALRALPTCTAPQAAEPPLPAERRSVARWTLGGLALGAMIDTIVIVATVVSLAGD